MANLLESLAGGLRSAAGVLNPRVQEQTFAADERTRGRAEQLSLEERRMQMQMQQQLMMQQQQHAFQQSTPQAQMQMEALKNERGFRTDPRIKSGDPEQMAAAAVEWGKSDFAMQLYKSQEDRAARLQVAADANQRQLYEIDKRLEDKQLSRDVQTALAAQRDETTRRGQDINAAMAQMHDSTKRMLGTMQKAQTGMMTEFQRQSLDLRRDTQEQNLDLRRDQQVNTQVGSLANHLQQYKIPGLVASVQSANDMLKKYEGKDIPGIGIVAGSEKIPNAFRSQEANDVRSSVQATSNDLLNMYSGLAVTLPEGERRDLEQMRGGGFSVGDFKNAWPRVVKRLNTVVGNMKASVSPKAIEEYQSRPGAMNMNPIPPTFEKKDKSIMEKADEILSGKKP